MNLARTDFESGTISRPEFLAQVDSELVMTNTKCLILMIMMCTICTAHVPGDFDFYISDKICDVPDVLIELKMSGEEKHEDGRGSKQLQIVHQGDQKIIQINQCVYLNGKLQRKFEDMAGIF